MKSSIILKILLTPDGTEHEMKIRDSNVDDLIRKLRHFYAKYSYPFPAVRDGRPGSEKASGNPGVRRAAKIEDIFL